MLAPLVLGTVLVAAGCGGSHRTQTTSAGAQVESGGCESSSSNGKPASESCLYVFSDGRQLRCGKQFNGQTPTVRQLERAGCRRLAPLKLSASERALIARLDQARSCLTARGRRALGGAILPPIPPGSTQPDGELVISSTHPAFIAFYTDAARAMRLEPGIRRDALRTHALVERRGTVTVVWTRAPAGEERGAVWTCAAS